MCLPNDDNIENETTIEEVQVTTQKLKNQKVLASIIPIIYSSNTREWNYRKNSPNSLKR